MRGCIYRIVCNDGSYYIGSTKQKLFLRKAHHKRLVNNGRESKLYEHIRRIGWENVKFEVVEEVEYITEHDLLFLEREYLESCMPDTLCLNSYKPYLTDLERQEYNAFHSLRWRRKKQLS